MTLTPPVTGAERLLKLARAAKLQRSSVTAPIEPVERGGALALSFAQRLRVTPVPWTHLSMLRAPNAAALGEALSRALDRAGKEAAPLSAGDRSRPDPGSRPRTC